MYEYSTYYPDDFNLDFEEQNQIAEENKEFLKEYDEKIESMTFHHLPQKNNKMEFTLVDDIKPEDLCDYAIMPDFVLRMKLCFQPWSATPMPAPLPTIPLRRTVVPPSTNGRHGGYVHAEK